jgi:hypothetical protein
MPRTLAEGRDAGKLKKKLEVVAMKGWVAAAATAALITLAAVPAGFAKDKKDNTANQEPTAWGMQSGNDGCVIFRETQTVTTEPNGPSGFTTHTVNDLEVLDSMHANLPKKKYDETKEGLDDLSNLGQQQHLRFVKIPKKYTPEQLEKAKTMCGVTP